MTQASSSTRSGVPTIPEPEGGQLGQALDGVVYLLGSHLLSLFIQDNDDLMRIGPIDASIPHEGDSLRSNGSCRSVAFYNSARSTTLYQRSAPGEQSRKAGLYTMVEPWGVGSLSSTTFI
jgi:hypothetical protein